MRSDSSAAFPSCRGGRLPPPCLGGWSSGAGKVAAPGPHPPVPSPLFRPPLLGARRRLRATSSAPSRTEARPEGLGRAPPPPPQQPPRPAGDVRSALPVPEPRPGRLVLGTRPCSGASSSSSGHNPRFPLAGIEGRVDSSRPPFPTHFSSAVKKLALLPTQKGTRISPSSLRHWGPPSM